MPIGDKTFIAVRYLPNSPSIFQTYRGYRIFGYFKIIGDLRAGGKSYKPDENPGLERLSSTEYWQPFLQYGDLNYYDYTEGDAALNLAADSRYRERASQGIRSSTAAEASYEKKKSTQSRWEPGYVRGGAAQGVSSTMFRAIAKFRPFPKGTPGVTENPYPQNMIQVWVKDIDTAANPKEFWYHPFLNFFYPFPDIDEFTEFDTIALQTISENLGRSFTEERLAKASGEYKSTDVNLTSIQVSMRDALVKLLIKQGRSASAAQNEINSLIERFRSVSFSGEVGANLSGSTPSQSGSNTPSAGTPGTGLPNKSTTNNGITKTVSPLVTKVTIRGAFGVGFGSAELDDRNNRQYPQMVQYFSNDVLNKIEPRRFDFKFAPQQISYSSIGTEWSEIPRAGKVPLVDWTNYRLMKISFQFVIGNPDSLDDSIDNELQTLRLMAGAPYPVVILGYDDLFTQKLQYSDTENTIPEFVIQDMNINSVYRNAGQKINRATVDITLQEIPIEQILLTEMPRISTPIKPPAPPATPPEYGSKPLLSVTSRTYVPQNSTTSGNGTGV